MSVSLDLVHGSAHDLLMIKELNPLVRNGTGRNDPTVRTNPTFVAAAQARVNTGRSTYNALEFQLDQHLGNTYQYRVAYTYSRSRGNTSGNGAPVSNFQVLGDMNLDENEGPTDFDRPHNFVFSGSWRVPRTHGLTLATVTRYLSGEPFTIFNSNFDPNRNGILVDPLPKGKYDSCTGKPTPCTPSVNDFTVFSDGGRNGARGPDFFEIDLRAGYNIPIMGFATELFAELFNVTNRANFANPNGDQSATNFLVLSPPLRAGGVPRTGQFGVRVTF